MSYRDEVLADSPTFYCECEETSGTTLADSSGNGFNGTLVGGTALTADGRVGRGIQFDGVDDRVSFGTRTGGANIAFELWVYPTGNPTSITGLMGVGAATNPRQRLLMFTDRTLRFDCARASDTAFAETLTASALALNTWTHVVALVENGASSTPTMRILYNGSQVASSTKAQAFATYSGDTFVGQRDGGNRTFVGRLDELAFYGNGLTVARATAHYDARDDGPLPAADMVETWNGAAFVSSPKNVWSGSAWL